MSLALIADLPGFTLDPPTIQNATVRLVAHSTRIDAACPDCASPTTDIHSPYTRRLADVPWSMKSAHLTLHVHRFRCHNAACARRTFVERLPTLALPYAHRTCRLATQQQHLALALGGEAGARMSQRLHMATSPATMLRLIRAFELPPAPPPCHIGIDDWANRKGHTYGTLIIDLDTRRPIDLLPTRTVEVVVAWLNDHPTVDVISRDRADVYRNGATQGAPHAQQETTKKSGSSIPTSWSAG